MGLRKLLFFQILFCSLFLALHESNLRNKSLLQAKQYIQLLFQKIWDIRKDFILILIPLDDTKCSVLCIVLIISITELLYTMSKRLILIKTLVCHLLSANRIQIKIQRRQCLQPNKLKHCQLQPTKHAVSELSSCTLIKKRNRV